MATRPRRLPVAVQLDANGAGQTTLQPSAAYYLTVALTLKAATLSSPVFDVQLGADPVLFGTGQRVELGPMILAPGEQMTVTVTNGAPGDTVSGTLWGVQSETDWEAAAALQGVMANGYVPPVRLRLTGANVQQLVSISGGAATLTVPVPVTAVGLIIVPASGLRPQISSITAVGDQTGTPFNVYRSGGMWCIETEAGAGQSGSIGPVAYDVNVVVTINAPSAGIGPWRVTTLAAFAGGMPSPQPSSIQGINFNVAGANGVSGTILAGVANKSIRVFSWQAMLTPFPNSAAGNFFGAVLQSSVTSVAFGYLQGVLQTGVGVLGLPGSVTIPGGMALPIGEGMTALMSFGAAGTVAVVGCVFYSLI